MAPDEKSILSFRGIYFFMSGHKTHDIFIMNLDKDSTKTED